MRNLRTRYSYQDRLEFADTIDSLRFYIMPLLMKRQNNTCAICKKLAKSYDIDHVIYNPMMTLQHVRALCWPCHKKVTDFSTFKNRNMAKLRHVNTSQNICFAT